MVQSRMLVPANLLGKIFTKSVMDKPFFENLTAIFGMCSLEVSVLIYKTFLIRSEKFPYKIFKHLKNLLKK